VGSEDGEGELDGLVEDDEEGEEAGVVDADEPAGVSFFSAAPFSAVAAAAGSLPAGGLSLSE